MVPDLPIFLPFLPNYVNWHSRNGILTLDLVSVLLLLGLFHLLYREPLISLLPNGLAGRAAALRPSYRIIPIVLGALVGAASHVLWDRFTHSNAAGFWGVGWFDYEVLGVIRVFRLLQYTSSVVGLAIVIWWVWRGLARMPATAVPDRLKISPGARLAVLGVAVVGTVAGAIVWPFVDEPIPELGIPSVITKVGAGTLVGLCLVLTGYMAVWQVRRLMAVFEGA